MAALTMAERLANAGAVRIHGLIEHTSIEVLPDRKGGAVVWMLNGDQVCSILLAPVALARLIEVAQGAPGAGEVRHG